MNIWRLKDEYSADGICPLPQDMRVYEETKQAAHENKYFPQYDEFHELVVRVEKRRGELHEESDSMEGHEVLWNVARY